MIDNQMSFNTMASQLQTSDSILCIRETDGKAINTTTYDITATDVTYTTEQLERYTPHLAYDIKDFCIRNIDTLTERYLRMSPRQNVINTAIIDFTDIPQAEIEHQPLSAMSQTQFEQFQKTLLIKIDDAQKQNDTPTYEF